MYLRSMISVSVIGSGNVASHLISAFLNSTSCKLIEVYSRNIDNITHLEGAVSITNDLKALKPVDVIVIAVSDNAIKDLTQNISLTNTLIVHTSGSVSMKVLKPHKNIGVFYPLQSFNKDKKLNIKKVPFCLETNLETSLVLLEKLGSAISNQIYFIDSEQRKKIHLAAVFANNFTNHMLYHANEICETHNIPFDILKPLIRETIKKIKTGMPLESQTGPAKRGDIETIKNQQKQLIDSQLEIYDTITKSILNTYKING
ncbi:DUF2520 domain-containing protein [Urechidicola sp. KH5]